MKVYISLILIIIIIYIYCRLFYHNVNYVISNVDNQKYLVRNIPDKIYASNLLAKIKINMLKLNSYLMINIKKFDEYKSYIELLNSRIHNVVLRESSSNDNTTSYSINKGDSIVFCLRSKTNNELYDLNLLMYVAIHEMAHIACPEYDHTPLFKKIFAFFIRIAIELEIYKYINFDKNHINYCGLTITNSII